MRTNIDIDDKLMADAIKASDAPSKRCAVQWGLELLIRTRRQVLLREFKGKVAWKGDHDFTRRGKYLVRTLPPPR